MIVVAAPHARGVAEVPKGARARGTAGELVVKTLGQNVERLRAASRQREQVTAVWTGRARLPGRVGRARRLLENDVSVRPAEAERAHRADSGPAVGFPERRPRGDHEREPVPWNVRVRGV